MKKLLFWALFCAISAFAQFDNLRGPAYNPYGTLGAAPTIADLIAKPSDIYGHKFIYIAPIDYTGYSAFDLAGGSAFLGFGNSLILGYAKNSWGLSLDWAPHKLWASNNERYAFDEYEVREGDNIGLNVSFAFKNFMVYGGTSWLTRKSYLSIYSESSTRYFVLGVTGGNKLIWDIALDFNRFEGITEYESDNLYMKSNDTISTIKMQFSFGYKALQNDRARLIIGLNNSFYWQFYEYFSDLYTDDWYYRDSRSYNLRLNISPNIFGEVVLAKHLLAFMGACYNIYLYDFDGYGLYIQSNNILGAYFGLRYEREGWAVETRLRNVFEEGYDGKNPFINLGGFIYF